MSGVIVSALREALGGLLRSKGTGPTHERTDEDIHYPTLIVIGLVTAVAIFLYFRFVVMAHLAHATSLSLIALALALVVAFLFTTVSAWAIATISVTPISGMTVTTIIITAVALLAAGLPKGDEGMLIVLLVGGVVAAALSMAGTLVTEFKIGYWTGATPKRIQWSAILASLLASALVTGTIMVLAGTYGYDSTVRADALQAPQANMMASALQSFVGGGSVPWLMYGVGAVVAVLMNLVGVSPLAFGLGMYLPMELNTPILLGAIVADRVKKSTRDEAVAKARGDRGILIASGLIAGAAILGVVKSLLLSFPVTQRFVEGLDRTQSLGGAAAEPWLNTWGLVAFLVLCMLVYLDCLRGKPERAEGQ
jgi:putative OPT family oligopeptide transporter